MTDDDLTELSEHAFTFQCTRGKELTERAIAELRELRALLAMATPEVVGAIRFAVEQHVDRWYVKNDGSPATINDAGPVGQFLAALKARES